MLILKKKRGHNVIVLCFTRANLLSCFFASPPRRRTSRFPRVLAFLSISSILKYLFRYLNQLANAGFNVRSNFRCVLKLLSHEKTCHEGYYPVGTHADGLLFVIFALNCFQSAFGFAEQREQSLLLSIKNSYVGKGFNFE